MHCADICLSATHNESARKLVMTQFEPCQYRHKSRYASVLQNRCFYTYIWLAYLVRFFERLLRQTTPKLLPLFECLPLLFLLMSLRYSVRPNIPGNISHLREQGQPQPNGAFQSYGCDYGVEIVRKAGESRPYAWETVKFLANLVSTVYSDTVTTVQPASLRMHCLIRYQ